jgi:hypothetical protein
MLIERTGSDRLTITVSTAIDSRRLQGLIDHVRYLEATAGSKAKQADIDKLADEVNEDWWNANKDRFAK